MTAVALKGKRVAIMMSGQLYRGTLAEVSEDWWTLRQENGQDLHLRPGQVDSVQELGAKPWVIG